MNTFHQNKRAIRLTDAQETEIRRRFFKLNHDPAEICRDFGIGAARMRVIVGGPISKKYNSGIEKAYAG